MRDNIFAELYNKLLGFFRQAEEEEKSKDVACNRLRVVLMQDRTNLTPQLLERMRGELVELLSKYLEMDKEALELNLEQEGDQMALMLSIPVIRAKDEEEIEKTLAQEAQKSEEEEAKDADEVDETENEEESEESESASDEITEETTQSKEDVIISEENRGFAHPSTKEDYEKTQRTSSKKFPNKEICGDCRECELSEDIECEKKTLKKK